MHRCLLSPYSRGETRPQEPPFGPGRGLSEAVAAEITCGRGCGEGGICVGLGRQGALCSRAQVGKYIGQALSCTHPPRSQAPNAFCPGKKRGIVCAGCTPREIFLLFFCLELLLFLRKKSPDVKICPPFQHILPTKSKSVAASTILMNL